MTDDEFTEVCLWSTSVSFGILLSFSLAQMESVNSEGECV